MAVAYVWRSITDTFQAQRQILQNCHLPGLSDASVRAPLHPSHAQRPASTTVSRRAYRNQRRRQREGAELDLLADLPCQAVKGRPPGSDHVIVGRRDAKGFERTLTDIVGGPRETIRRDGEESHNGHANKPVWSLFSGAMGLDLGLEAAGFEPKLAVELDKWCCETIRLNRRGTAVIERDVTQLRGRDLREVSGAKGDVFLIVGGPPCQSFSPGGNRAALSDPRGVLIYEFFRIVDEVRPQYFVFENVANLVTAALRHRPIAERPGRHWNLGLYSSRPTAGNSDALAMESDELSGSAVRALLNDVQSLGYHISFGVLDAADYGAPQRRLRFVMLGSRDTVAPALPEPTHGDSPGLKPWATVKEAIGDLRLNPGPHYRYTEKFREYFDRVPPGGNWRNLPADMQREAMGGSYAAGGGKTGFFRRLDWDALSPTITGKPNRKGAALCHPEFTRPLSVRECARIQGFPDEWSIAGPLQDMYRQIGNAVPFNLGSAIGRSIAGHDGTGPVQDVDVMLDAAIRRLRRAARNKRSATPGQMVLA